MRKRNLSGKIMQLRMLTPVDLLVFLLTALLVLAMVSLSGADMWDETLAKAKKEGKLVAALGTSASRNYRPIFKFFESKFGIRTIVYTGGGVRQTDRLLVERGAGKYKVDIFMVGPPTGNRRIIANGAADPIKPLLFLPDVVDQSLWFKGKHQYSDPEQKYIFTFSAVAELSPIAMRFNTNKLPVKEAKKIDSVWSFLDKRFAGKIVAIPPTAGGSRGSYLVAQAHPDIGEEYLRRLFDPGLDVKFIQDYRKVADGVARGKYTMAMFIGAGGRDIDRLGKQGLPVKNFTQMLTGPLKERPVLQGNGSANNLMVVNRRPHPYATKLFVNWFLSKEGQTIKHTKSERAPDQSFREDVTEMGKVNEPRVRRPGIDYMNFPRDPSVIEKQIWFVKNAQKLYRQIRGK